MIALYLRLSSADGDLGSDGKDESNSIESQRSLLKHFIRKREDLGGEVKEYIDDGYSGTNFDRPAFRQMMEDVKSGSVDVIMTKDLSRLGRNYIEVGDYMEQVFPMLGVRYIAVNSNYDSNDYIGNTLGIEMSMMNLVNSLYSRDLSGKVKSAFNVRWKSGKSTSGRPAFGYVLDPEDKTKWVTEPEAAGIVRKIFDLAIEGNNAKSIAEILNDDETITPGAYREKHGHTKINRRIISDDEYMWDYTMVWRILKAYEYTGAMVHGKAERVTVGSTHVRKVPENERFIFEGHHEPIVTKEEFDKAGAVIRSTRYSGKMNPDNYPLSGKVFCGNCGLRMMRKNKVEPCFTCSHKHRAGLKSGCSDAKYPNDHIEVIVRKVLQNQLMQMRELSDDIKISGVSVTDPFSKLQKIDREIKTLKANKTMLYESYAEGCISKTKYLAKKEAIAEKICDLEQKKQSVTEAAAENRKLIESTDQYLRLAETLEPENGLSRAIVDAFVDRVIIHDETHYETRFKFDDLLQKLVDEARNEYIKKVHDASNEETENESGKEGTGEEEIA